MLVPTGDSIQTDFLALLAPGKNCCSPEPISGAPGLENLVTPALVLQCESSPQVKFISYHVFAYPRLQIGAPTNKLWFYNVRVLLKLSSYPIMYLQTLDYRLAPLPTNFGSTM